MGHLFHPWAAPSLSGPQFPRPVSEMICKAPSFVRRMFFVTNTLQSMSASAGVQSLPHQGPSKLGSILSSRDPLSSLGNLFWEADSGQRGQARDGLEPHPSHRLSNRRPLATQCISEVVTASESSRRLPRWTATPTAAHVAPAGWRRLPRPRQSFVLRVWSLWRR